MDNGRIHTGNPQHGSGISTPGSPDFADDASARMPAKRAFVPPPDQPVVPEVDAPLHVVPCEEGWSLRFEGTDVVAAIVPTKKQAMSRARALASERSLRIVEHGRDGRIRG